MKNIKKANRALIFLFVISTIIGILLRLLNSDYLEIAIVAQSFLKMKSINLISFIMQIGLMFGILTKIKPSKCIKLTFSYIPIYVLSDIAFSGNMIHTTITPLTFILIASAYEEENIIQLIKNIIIFTAMTAIYQLAMIYARTNITSLFKIFNQLEILQRQGLCIDYIIFLFIILLERRNIYAKFFIHTNKNSNAETSNEDCEAVAIFNSLNKIAKLKIVIIIAGVQLLQLSAIFMTALLINRVPELLLILISFWLARSYLQPSYHADNIFICTAISATIFYVATASSIPINKSIFTALIIGSVVAIAMNLVYIIIEKLKNKEDVETKPFNLENLTINSLENIAIRLNLNKDTKEFLKLKYIDKLKNTQIAELLFIEPHSVAMRVNRIKKKISKMT